MIGTHTHDASRELAYRETDGLEVQLLWDERTNVARVAVLDWKTGNSFEIVLGDGDNGLDVFHHPYAYAAHRGVDYCTPTRRQDVAVAA
jgi:hypothetical protein